jgi:serine/threonine protein kinase/Flp pilus assembly protein TadD
MKDDFDRGRRVGKYEILTRLSVGGMAELFLAFLPGPGGFKKFVALKQILPDVRSDEEFVKMFLDEARITAALSHPNIGQVFDLGRDEASGELYLAMEFIAGQNLAAIQRTVSRAGRRIPLPIAARIARDMCLALSAAHSFVDPAGRPMPVIHRDVAPKNVMVSYSGHVKVIDFGIAKARGRLIRTRTGQSRGTLTYMAPEQLEEKKAIDARTDLYAVGIVLHEMLTGERLFRVDAPGAVLRLDGAALRDPRDVNPEVPEALARATLQALERDPGRRPQTGKAFARAIEEACPRLADEDDLASFMAQLFATQLASSRELFDAAQRESAPEDLSGLVHALADSDDQPLATPTRLPSGAPQDGALATDVPRRPAVAAPWRWGLAGGLALVVVGTLVARPQSSEAPAAVASTRESDAERLPKLRAGRSAAAQVEVGDSLMSRGDFSGARAAYEAAIAMDPQLFSAHAGAGAAARRERKFESALGHLQRALEFEDVSAAARGSVFVDLACTQAQMGDTGGALASLERAKALVKRDWLLGALRFDPELEPLRALPRFRGLVEQLDEQPPRSGAGEVGAPGAEPALALVADARGAMKARDFERAIWLLNRCTQLAPQLPDCHLLLGSAWAHVGGRDLDQTSMERARRSYERFLQLAPPNNPAALKVRRMLEQAGWR